MAKPDLFIYFSGDTSIVERTNVSYCTLLHRHLEWQFLSSPSDAEWQYTDSLVICHRKLKTLMLPLLVLTCVLIMHVEQPHQWSDARRRLNNNGECIVVLSLQRRIVWVRHEDTCLNVILKHYLETAQIVKQATFNATYYWHTRSPYLCLTCV